MYILNILVIYLPLIIKINLIQNLKNGMNNILSKFNVIYIYLFNDNYSRFFIFDLYVHLIPILKYSNFYDIVKMLYLKIRAFNYHRIIK